MNEHSENAIVAAIRNGLRRPPRSAAAPTNKAESAHAKESAEAVSVAFKEEEEDEDQEEEE